MPLISGSCAVVVRLSCPVCDILAERCRCRETRSWSGCWGFGDGSVPKRLAKTSQPSSCPLAVSPSHRTFLPQFRPTDTCQLRIRFDEWRWRISMHVLPDSEATERLSLPAAVVGLHGCSESCFCEFDKIARLWSRCSVTKLGPQSSLLLALASGRA